jgi:hypothetical protein
LTTNFDDNFFRIFEIFMKYCRGTGTLFYMWRSRGETFMKIRALTFRLRRVFFLKNNIAVPVRAFLSFSAFCVVRGTLPWAIPAPVRGIKAFFGAKRHLFARGRAYKHVRALNYG